MCAFSPPRFRTRNSDDFLKAQSSVKPNSDSNTQVLYAGPRRRRIRRDKKRGEVKQQI